MFQSAPPPSTGWIYVHVYLTAALTAYGCESLAGDALHASTCLPYSHFGSALAVDSLCIRDRLLYTDAALLPFGKQLKTQLSVMGMSLRIWTWSAISLTLKPRVEITLIAASRDSLNPPSCLSGFFPLWQLSGRLRAFLRLQNSLLPHQLAHRNGYVFLIVQKSSLMTFLCTYLLQSWITYKFLTRNAVSRKRLPKREKWESEFLCNIQVFYVVFFCKWADKLKSVRRGLIFKQAPTLELLNRAITSFPCMDSCDWLTITPAARENVQDYLNIIWKRATQESRE